MSLVVEFQPHTGSRLRLWSHGLDVPFGLYIGILVLDLLGLDYRSKDSPHRLPLPELNTPSEVERMTDDFVRGMKQIHAQNRSAAMEAIAHRDELRGDVDRLERLSSQLEHEATEALAGSDRETAKQRLKAKAVNDRELQTRRAALTEAEAGVEVVKQYIRQAEEQLKSKAAELSTRFPENMAEAQRPAFASRLRDTLEALSVGQSAELAEAMEAQLTAENGLPEKKAEVSAEPAKAVSTASDTEPIRVTLDFSQDSEALIAAQAHERGLTSEEYISTIADHLVGLADLVTPKDMPPTRDSDVHHDTPIEEILNEAVREMKENQIRNREYAVKAITHKNYLRADVDKEERLLAEYKRKALAAMDDGNRELAQRFYKEMLPHEQTLMTMRTLLAQATDVAEKIKQQIRQSEERVRVRTSKALLLKANLNASVIAFRLDMLLEEALPPAQEEFQQNFEEWIQSQRPPAS